MMTFTTASAVGGLAQLPARPVIRGDDVRQFMQACLFALTNVMPAVRADLDSALRSVSAAASLPTHHGYRACICPERSREPAHLLDNMNVACTMLVVDCAVILYQDFAG